MFQTWEQGIFNAFKNQDEAPHLKFFKICLVYEIPMVTYLNEDQLHMIQVWRKN